MNDMSAPTPRRRGRPPKSATETPQQRVARLQAELEAAQEAVQAGTAKQAQLVGAAVIAEAQKNADFHLQLATLLRANVTRKADTALIADLLA